MTDTLHMIHTILVRIIGGYNLDFASTVDSRYLEVQWTLKNISRYPYLDISALQN